MRAMPSSPNGDISTFLQYANVPHSYRDVLVTAGITRVSHLKDAEEEDFLEYGMSKPCTKSLSDEFIPLK